MGAGAAKPKPFFILCHGGLGPGRRLWSVRVGKHGRGCKWHVADALTLLAPAFSDGDGLAGEGVVTRVKKSIVISA